MDLGTWARANKYGDRIDYDAAGLTKAPTTPGLYLLEFSDGQSYVGISTKLRGRLRQHGQRFSDIEGFRLQPIVGTPAQLRTRERELVHSAQKAGLTIRNREHAAVIGGVTMLNELISPAEQEVWLADPTSVDPVGVDSPVTYAETNMKAAHADSFRLLQNHPRYAEIVDALAIYLRLCVPFPVRSEGTFWTVSCRPSKRRVLCVSAAVLELFYLWDNPETGCLEAHLFIDERGLPAKWQKRNKTVRWLSDHAALGLQAHKSAGPYERSLGVVDIVHLEEALTLPGVTAAAGLHAMSVMRRRQSGYKISHNPHLAAAAIDVAGLMNSERIAEIETTVVPEEAPNFAAPASNADNDAASKPQSVTAQSAESADAADAKLAALEALDSNGIAQNWLRDFLDHCVPDHRADAGVHWAVSCMPSTGPKQRLFTVNASSMEVAYLYVSREANAVMHGCVVISESALVEFAGKSAETLAAASPDLAFRIAGYKAAAGDDLTIQWQFTPESLRQLEDLPWREASAVLVDALRGSHCSYSRYHSAVLYESVVDD